MTDEIRDSYGALELKTDASPEAVKAAYRELVKVWHPDRFSGDEKLERRAQEKLKTINLAYERIKDRQPQRNPAAAPPGNTPPRGTPFPPSGMAPGVKTTLVPNSRDVKLGCLLVGGVACLIGALVIVALFYDDSKVGRRYVTDAAAKKTQVKRPGSVGGSNSVSSADSSEALSEIVNEEIDANPRLTIEMVEQQLAALEEKARASAIASIGLPPTGRADRAEESVRNGIASRTGKRLDFVTEEYYRTGIAHLRSGRGSRDVAWAVDYFQQAADRGHPDAQYQLALMLRDGRGIEANLERAFYWILIAADLGQQEAVRSRTSFQVGLNPRRMAELRAEALKRTKDFKR